METFVFEKRQPAACITLKGEDALAFAQSQGTQDLRKGSGFAGYTLWLDHKGRIHGDGYVLVENEETVHVISIGTSSQVIKEKFERHIIADDVEIEDQTDARVLILMKASGDVPCFENMKMALPEANRFLNDGGNYTWRTDYWGKGTIAMLTAVPPSFLSEGQEILLGQSDRMRIEAGTLLIPMDLNEQSTPLEGPLKHAISYDKGCYLGQEVVNRLTRLERTKTRIYRFHSDQCLKISQGIVTSSSSEIGEIRSCIIDTRGTIGFALIKEKDFSEDALVDSQSVRWLQLENREI